jgi:hypothetical protein
VVVVQSSALLLCADGMANEAVARECSTTPDIAAGSGMYYFYVADPEFGPGFIKVCTYFPRRHSADRLPEPTMEWCGVQKLDFTRRDRSA